MNTFDTDRDAILNLAALAPRRQPGARFRAAALALLAFTALTGLAYPLAVTGLAQLLFPAQANGSRLVDRAGALRGSRLLAQDFSGGAWFQARPSAVAWAATASGASNLAPTSRKLAEQAAARQAAWAARFGGAAPAEMVYASGSGLDPDIGLPAALAQVGGVAAARGLDAAAAERLAGFVRGLAERNLPGEAARVNVVDLNFALLEGRW